MESLDTANNFFRNVAYLLKPNGHFICMMHDGASIWSMMQKEIPDSQPAADFKPSFKKKLYSVNFNGLVKDRVGVWYRVQGKKEEGDFGIGLENAYLINNRVFLETADGVGLKTLHMLNAVDMLNDYKGIYVEALKKRINGSSLLKEQKEVVSLFALAILKMG